MLCCNIYLHLYDLKHLLALHFVQNYIELHVFNILVMHIAYAKCIL